MAMARRFGRGWPVLACSTAVLCTGSVASAQAAPLTPAVTARSVTASRPGARLATNPGETLRDVTAISSSDAWIVGDDSTSTTGRSVVIHWNGSAWSPVPIPSPSANFADAIAGTSGGTVWAAGDHCARACPNQASLILRWNGTGWTRMPSPNPDPTSHANGYDAISASSASDAWAVGTSSDAALQIYQPLIAHWNGTAWSRSAAPKSDSSAQLRAVTAPSADDAWILGGTCDNGCPLILHWNGTAWANVTAPTDLSLLGITATPGGDAWAAGYVCVDSCGGMATVIYRWNGTKWVRSASPNPGTSDVLFGVNAVSADDAWAVGDSCTDIGCNHEQALILHWNGKTWSRVASPSPGPDSSLASVAGTSGSNAWAVGSSCNSSGLDCAALILHWNGKTWAAVGVSGSRGTTR
jgi:hypothetical protein